MSRTKRDIVTPDSFQSKAQWKQCFALKNRGENGSWDCEKDAKNSPPYSDLPLELSPEEKQERKKERKSVKRSTRSSPRKSPRKSPTRRSSPRKSPRKSPARRTTKTSTRK